MSHLTNLTYRGTRYFSTIFRRRRRIDWLLLLGICIVTSFVYLTFYSQVAYNQRVTLQSNYFQMSGKREYLIQLPGCTIPRIMNSEENESTIPRVDPSRAQCEKDRPKLTYVKGNILYGIPQPSNFFLNGHLECCYRGIIRIFGTDKNVEISESCENIDLHGGTEVTKFSAVVVECKAGRRKFKDVHPIILKNDRKKRNPEAPNIVILGLDSVPRYHFQHYMPKTRKHLESLGAYDFMGYTKVGENTFPNMVPFLSGYQDKQIFKFCAARDRPFDFCPFIWEGLKMSTAFIEDSPRLGIFNFAKFGFLNSPFDHYLRPLMQVADKMYSEVQDALRLFPCVGSAPAEEFVLTHIKSLLEEDTPLFSFNWLTSLAHEGPELLPYADDLIYKWLQSLDLSHTILIFMSDHGYRYSGNRTSFNGWYNDKLPFLTITLPPKVKAFLGPQRLNALKTNTRRLTTPFDGYKTLAEILQLYELKDFENDLMFTPDGSAAPDPDVQRLYGQSLFKEISETRTCQSAGIPPAFCACADFHPIDVSKPELEQIALAAIDKINPRLPRRCSTLQLSRIIGGASLENGDMIVGFVVQPGEFHYEAYAPSNGNVSSYRITRTNPVSGTWCTSDFFWELYCDCNFFANLLEYVLGDGVAERSKF